MINIQGCDQTINIIAGDKVTFLLKELSQTFWREWNADTFTLSSRRFHCCALMPTVLLYPSEVPDL
jgi:hypothetical protein